MAEEKYLFGPVPSRRLGLSLGVDIVPLKTCTLDCIYCQLGATGEKTIERKDYVPVGDVLAELKAKLTEGLKADFITVSGSGEPTLNSRLGELVDGIKRITDIPVAILTNGTLLTEKDVRADCCRADVVLPSLDAGDEQTFQKINRPYKDISIEKLIEGLCTFRDEYPGQIWIEVFWVDGLNTAPAQVAKIKDAIRRIRPDKVQLNTAVRPTAEPSVKRVDTEKLLAIAEQLGPNCEIISSPCVIHNTESESTFANAGAIRNTILSMLKRRPCSLNDISAALGINRSDTLKYVGHLQNQGLVGSEKKGRTVFFKAN